MGSNYRFFFELSLTATIIMSVLLLGSNNVRARTLESLTLQRELLQRELLVPQIMVGDDPVDIKINRDTNKIYVANAGSGSVSVINSDSGNIKDLRVGMNPSAIAIDED